MDLMLVLTVRELLERLTEGEEKEVEHVVEVLLLPVDT